MDTAANPVLRALGHLQRRDRAEALRQLSGADEAATPLTRELARYLTAWHDGEVYEDPAAFVAFIDGGGNKLLYDAAATRLGATYASPDIRAVLDVGCGDGRVTAAATRQAGVTALTLDLVEPSAALLTEAVVAADGAGLRVRAHRRSVQDFLGEPGEARWDLCQATFALHAISDRERVEVLAGLRSRADRLLIAEFDVPIDADGGPEHLRYLADRYEAGLAEYAGDGGLVAQGFLIPLLIGQVEPGATRSTWEQPATAWAAQLESAGWQDVRTEPLCDYWWAPAVVLTADAGRTAGQ